ncbi:MAG: metallophosphoesterase family protein [Actinomycetota bacterium]|nr:metallophosphoesterase family protein [Actinomycetota bacterium]
MALWFTSDLHFGHTNIIRYSHRPFADTDEMNHALVQQWNELVQPTDTVWVLGDVAMGRIADTLPLAAELAGHKLLIAGNHDRCWEGHGPRAAEWLDRYRDAGFAEVHQGSVRLCIGGHHVTMSHFPYEGDSRDEDRYPAARPADEGGWLLHGHVHERWRQHERMINVGCDAWGWRPVSEAVVAGLIEGGPRDLAPLTEAGEPSHGGTRTAEV